tara:strand:+ start:20269 stop:20811 length:543 start_codon:yes stop_codon:yes gene_type:complete
MLKIIELLQKLIRPYYKIIVIITLVIIFGLVGYYGYKKYGVPQIENQKFKDVANSNRRNIEANLYYFSVDWCPYCKKAEQPWNDFVQQYDNKTIGNYKLKCFKIDCTNSESDDKEGIVNGKTSSDVPSLETTKGSIKNLMNIHKVEGYPTVTLESEGEIIQFDSKITDKTLEKFVYTMLT